MVGSIDTMLSIQEIEFFSIVSKRLEIGRNVSGEAVSLVIVVRMFSQIESVRHVVIIENYRAAPLLRST